MKLTLPVLLLLAASAAPTLAVPIAQWTFETSVPSTAGPHAPEVNPANGSATAFHASGATVYSNPVGNGSVESWSSNTWAPGDYYQFQVSTLGYQDIVVTWDQTRSSTGPGEFLFRYSTDQTNWTTSGYQVAVGSWSSASFQAGFSFLRDLSALPAFDNDSSVYFQLMNNESVASAASGSNRVDNFTVSGERLANVPETSPGMAGLAGALVLMAAFRLRGSR